MCMYIGEGYFFVIYNKVFNKCSMNMSGREVNIMVYCLFLLKGFCCNLKWVFVFLNVNEGVLNKYSSYMNSERGNI